MKLESLQSRLAPGDEAVMPPKPPNPIPWCLVSAVALLGCDASHQPGEQTDTFVVQRGDLPIHITEQAEIQPLTSTRIKNEMEGTSTIIYLIPEGTVVEKGQKLVELDASGLYERKAQQEITVHTADAARITAREEFEIRTKEFAAERLLGENTVRIAEIDMEKYLGKVQEDGSRDMGEREQQLVEAQANIQLADASLKLAQNKLEWSKTLYEKGFITKDDLEKDELDEQRQAKNLRVAENKLEILTKFTHPKEELRLRQGISQARTDLEGIIARGNALLAQAKADLESGEKEYELDAERLRNLEHQIASAVITAPTPGLVIYGAEDSGHYGRQEFVEEGGTVRERQTLIVLPDVSRMVAKLKIHEASVDKVRAGQRARIRVDAFPDHEFTGVVERVALVSDSGSRYTNDSLKVYNAEVALEGENTVLKPGMSASVTIVAADLEDVLYVPLQAVYRQGRVAYVWMPGARGPVARPIEVGLSDFRFAEVVSGLSEGDRVYLTAPPDAVPPLFEQPQTEARAAIDASLKEPTPAEPPAKRAGHQREER